MLAPTCRLLRSTLMKFEEQVEIEQLAEIEELLFLILISF